MYNFFMALGLISGCFTGISLLFFIIMYFSRVKSYDYFIMFIISLTVFVGSIYMAEESMPIHKRTQKKPIWDIGATNIPFVGSLFYEAPKAPQQPKAVNKDFDNKFNSSPMFKD